MSPKLEPGDEAPDFEAPATPKGPLKLSDLRGRWVVLYFYPMDETRGCVKQACDFRDARIDYQHRNAVVVGVSTQGTKSHQAFGDRLGLPFSLVADRDKSISRKYAGLTMFGVARRTTFLIDPEGVIRHIWRRVRPRGHSERVLKRLDELSPPKAAD
jgi:thioredoxin-dependent peroxiredoxin